MFQLSNATPAPRFALGIFKSVNPFFNFLISVIPYLLSSLFGIIRSIFFSSSLAGKKVC